MGESLDLRAYGLARLGNCNKESRSSGGPFKPRTAGLGMNDLLFVFLKKNKSSNMSLGRTDNKSFASLDCGYHNDG